MARRVLGPWLSPEAWTRLYVWTRRAGIWIGVVGAWETLNWLDGWYGGGPRESRDLLFWGFSAVIGWLLWLRLRHVEAEIREEAAQRSPVSVGSG